jgi:SynChlorMet cassette protein ScmC
MPDPSNQPLQFTSIKLADGRQWLLCPTDQESADIIARLAEVMQLSPGQAGTRIYVTVQRREHKPYALPGNPDNPVCVLPPGNDDEMRAARMMILGKGIALQALNGGGLLIHGALVARDGEGVILAGHGTVGKSTASRRIPLPWRALCDDATLVVRDPGGRYLAHPYPTWSRFFENGPGGSWAVEEGVPLRSIFLLTQAHDDYAEQIDPGDATVFLMESLRQIMGAPVHIGSSHDEAAEICQRELAAVNALVQEVPVNRLHISLTGRFWDEIEKNLEERKGTEPETGFQKMPEEPVQPDTIHPFFCDGNIPVVYTGTSMNPILREPELLEVAPYKEQAPAIGDIICFFDHEQDVQVIHRIIGVTPGGFRTQGDNTQVMDNFPVPQEDIAGKVIMAWQGNHHRRISGGYAGRLTRKVVRIKKGVRAVFAGFAHRVYTVFANARLFPRIVPQALKIRVVLFTTPESEILRVFCANTLIGEYSDHKKAWMVRFPFLLLVDTSALPTGVYEKPGILS